MNENRARGIRVDVAVAVPAYCVGRNGTRHIKAVAVWNVGDLTVLDCIGRRGFVLRAGVALRRTDFLRMCQLWLEKNGYVVTKGGL